MPGRNSTTCRFAFTAKGKANRRHQCRASCQWDSGACIAWLNRTPYPGQERPPVQIEHAPCDAGVSWQAHHVTTTDAGGRIRGIKFQTCEGRICVCEKRHLRTCDCLDCVSSRITADLRERIPA